MRDSKARRRPLSLILVIGGLLLMVAMNAGVVSHGYIVLWAAMEALALALIFGWIR